MTYPARRKAALQEKRRLKLMAALTLSPQTPEQLAAQLKLKPDVVRSELRAMEHLAIEDGGLLFVDGGWVIV